MYSKIFNSITPCSSSEYLNNSIPPYNMHSATHEPNIQEPLCRENVSENNFFGRRLTPTNSLLSLVSKSESVASSKHYHRTID